jgi:hypothetical protein
MSDEIKPCGPVLTATERAAVLFVATQAQEIARRTGEPLRDAEKRVAEEVRLQFFTKDVTPDDRPFPARD